jgi:hypothetical protein
MKTGEKYHLAIGFRRSDLSQLPATVLASSPVTLSPRCAVRVAER